MQPVLVLYIFSHNWSEDWTFFLKSIHYIYSHAANPFSNHTVVKVISKEQNFINAMHFKHMPSWRKDRSSTTSEVLYLNLWLNNENVQTKENTFSTHISPQSLLSDHLLSALISILTEPSYKVALENKKWLIKHNKAYRSPLIKLIGSYYRKIKLCRTWITEALDWPELNSWPPFNGIFNNVGIFNYVAEGRWT